MPSTFISHGSASTPVLMSSEVDEVDDGLDTARASYLSDDPSPYVKGQAVTIHGGTFYINRVSNRRDGELYEHEISASGLLVSPKQLTGYPDKKINQEDWDTVEDVVLTTNPNYFRRGQFGNYGGTTICLSANPKPVNASSTLYRVSGSFKGLIEQKPYKRVITSNGQKISGDAIIVNLPNGWTTARKGNASLPKILVTDTYFSTSPAPTASVPGNRTPPNAPPVSIITFTGGDVTSHWPWGWEFSCGQRQIAGAALYEVDMIYEWVPRYTP